MTSEIHRVANFQRFKLLHLDLFFAFVLAVFQLYVNKGRLLGNDYNWDLLNYHLSNVTLEQDLALHASGIQSYLPSTLDRMILPIHTLIPSPFSGLLMLVPLICNYIILRKLFIQKLLNDSLHLPKTVVVVSLSTSVALSQINNSMGDLVLSPFVLAGIAMFLIGIKNSNSNLLTLSALPFAVAFSLKWTYVYVPMSLFILLIVLVATRVMKISILIKWATLNAGLFTLFSFYHFIKLYKGTGNPVFPFANTIFKAKSFPEVNFRDSRYGFRTLSDFFETPIRIALGKEGGTSELLFQDARLLVILVSFLLWTIYFYFMMNSRQPIKTDVFAYFGLFIFLAYILWGYLFGISRYFLAIEFLVPILALGILSKIFSTLAKQRLIDVLLTLGLTLILVSTTSYVNWGYDASRTSNIAFEKAIYPVNLAPKSALIMADMPLAFMSYQIRSKSNVIYLSPAFNENNLQDQLRLIGKRVIYSLSYNKNLDFLNPVLSKYNVKSSSKCQTIDLDFNNGLTPSAVFLCESESL